MAEHRDHAASFAANEQLREDGWDHGRGEIVTALIDWGLRIESLEERPVRAPAGAGRAALDVLPAGHQAARTLNGRTLPVRATRERTSLRPSRPLGHSKD